MAGIENVRICCLSSTTIIANSKFVSFSLLIFLIICQIIKKLFLLYKLYVDILNTHG